ncbi:MAG: BamA/TamA family outer membrane protein, partial [Vicinamibacterales bacterium]
ARGRLRINGRARWQDAPELAVYALGPDSPTTRADYSETKTEISGQAELRPVSFLRFGAGAAYERYETGGADTARSSVEELFTPAEMRGIDADPRYLHTFVSGGIDSRTGPGYSRHGSLLHASLHDYRQQNDGPYSFRRVDAIARQLIPILHGNWVIDLSVRTSTTSVDDGNEVPFFLLPDLGGSGELRGYSSYRFRDRHSIIFTGEYRWYVQEFVDMAVFYDAGKVASRRSDLDFEDLKSNVGLGIRFHGPTTTVLRIEVAKGNEGLRFIFGFSAPIR